MTLAITNASRSQTPVDDRGASLFAQAVNQQRANPGMPQPTVTVTGGAATTGAINTQTAGVNVTVPLDADGTRVNVTATTTANDGRNGAGQPVSNLVQGATTSVSAPMGGVTVTGSVSVEDNRNNLNGRTTQGAGARVSVSDTIPLDARTNLNLTGSVGINASTPQGGATSLVAQPRVSVGVTHKASDRLSVGAQVNVGGNIPLNEAGAAGVAAAGNEVVVTGQVNASVQVAPNVRLIGSVTHGLTGADAPSTNPAGSAFSPGAGQTVLQGGVQITLP
ncbi:hypothetical protein [Salinarimonas soli]|uniref:Uncharacterized protein n=1 Tax=Salinarimonas soli TaxID=1638099 RepID=A0A5B2VUD1_9HYPH|nr:hypothetical protein [Salinarimonas soli]KAA2242218.1 hypothetical protein F0L46_02705 [Salinarimonas soli]